jgi:hypothetical protein
MRARAVDAARRRSASDRGVPQVPPGPTSASWTGILRRVLVAQDPPSDRIEPVIGPCRKRVERGVIARAVHAPRGRPPRFRPSVAARHDAASRWYWRSAPRNPSFEGIRPTDPAIGVCETGRSCRRHPKVEVRDVPEALAAPTARPGSRDRPGHRVWRGARVADTRDIRSRAADRRSTGRPRRCRRVGPRPCLQLPSAAPVVLDGLDLPESEIKPTAAIRATTPYSLVQAEDPSGSAAPMVSPDRHEDQQGDARGSRARRGGCRARWRYLATAMRLDRVTRYVGYSGEVRIRASIPGAFSLSPAVPSG